MAAFTDLDDLAVVMTGGGAGPIENLWAFTNRYNPPTGSLLTSGNNVLKSMWGMEGIPGPGSYPGTVTVPTSATDGAIPFTNASGGRQKFIVQAGTFPESSGVGSGSILYDRLLHLGGLSWTTTSVQTVGGTLTRNTGGEGNQIWIEVDTSTSCTAGRIINATYTNQAGTGSRVTEDLELFNEVSSFGTIYRLPLQAGDTGVQSVQSVQMASAGASGTFAVVVAKPLLVILNSNQMFYPPWPRIEDDACLAIALSARAGSFSLPMLFTICTAER